MRRIEFRFPVYSFGSHRVRLRSPEERYWWETNQTFKAEVIPASAQADIATPVASIDIPLYGLLYKVDDLLVSVQIKSMGWPNYQTTIKAFDFSDPANPHQAGELVTTGLPTYYGQLTGYVGNKSIAFVRNSYLSSNIGAYSQCTSYYWGNSPCHGQDGCTYLMGNRQCQTPAGGQEYCKGGFAECTDHVDAETTCVPLDWSEAEPLVYTWCIDGHAERSWRQFEINVVDLSNPANPTVVPSIPVPDEGVAVRSDGDDLYVTVKQPTTVPNNPRPHARYYVRKLDLSSPAQPVLGPAINTPGEFLAIDGKNLFTRDKVWGTHFQETAVAKLKLKGATARLENYHHFADRSITGLLIEDDKHVLVTHRPAWQRYWYGYNDPNYKLAILKPAHGSDDGFELLSNTPLPTWMGLVGTAEHRAFFNAYGGTLMVNVEDPEHPTAQAYFQSWYGADRYLIEGGDVLVAAGLYGIYQLDMDESNLLYDN